jgi:hypothetical protein
MWINLVTTETAAVAAVPDLHSVSHLSVHVTSEPVVGDKHLVTAMFEDSTGDMVFTHLIETPEQTELFIRNTSELVLVQHGVKVQRIRSERGGKHLSHEFLGGVKLKVSIMR